MRDIWIGIARQKFESAALSLLNQEKWRKLNKLIRKPKKTRVPPAVQSDYLTAVYNRCLYEAIFDCPIDRCVNMYGFPYNIGGWHPFVMLLKHFHDGNVDTYKGSVLERYYSRWQPKNAGEILMGEQSPSAKLQEVPAWAAYPPWMTGSRVSIIQMKQRFLDREHRIGGFDGLTVEVGFTGCGPVTYEKGKFEYCRLVDVYNSIAHLGYDRSHGDITGVVLRRGADYRVVVRDGNHRLAALSVLGWHNIPIQLTQLTVVDIDHLDFWPQVREGIWDQESALQYFNRLFDFDSRLWALEKNLL